MSELGIAAGLGAIAGLRTFSAPTLLARAARKKSIDTSGTPLAFLNNPTGAHVTAILALGELIADKTPWIPSRISAGPLIGRATAGALAAATIARARHEGWVRAALVGAGAAVGATFAAYHLRKFASNHTPIPDRVYGLIEDTVVVSAAGALLSSLKHSSAIGRL